MQKQERPFVVYRIDINDPLDSAVGRTEFPKFVSLTAADNALFRRVTCRFGSRALLFLRSEPMRPKDTRSNLLQPSSAAVSAAVVPDRSKHSHAASVLTMSIS